MIVLEKLESIFNILFWLYFILCIKRAKCIVATVAEKFNHEDDTTRSENAFWKYLIKILIRLLPVVIYIVIIVFLLKRKIYWLLILIAVPGCIKGISSIIKSFTIIKKIISVNKGNNLSYQELISFVTLGPVIMVFEKLNIFKNIIKRVSIISNYYLSDFLIALAYVLIYYVYIFFICSLFIMIVVDVANLVRKILNIMITNNKLEKIENYWIKQIDRDVEMNVTSLFISRYDKIKKEKSLCVKYFLILPMFLILDILIMFVKETICIVGETIGYFFILIQLSKNGFKNFTDWILTFSDRKIIYILFRIAVIIALMCIIALNRYQPIFKMQKQSTEILEFIASTIIIPVIFELVISTKTK